MTDNASCPESARSAACSAKSKDGGDRAIDRDELRVAREVEEVRGVIALGKRDGRAGNGCARVGGIELRRVVPTPEDLAPDSPGPKRIGREKGGMGARR